MQEIYDYIAEGIRIRSRCDWYEKGEKSSKCFLNLEKQNKLKSCITKLIVYKKEVESEKEIKTEIETFYKTLFANNSKTSLLDKNKYLDKIKYPILSEEEKALCNSELSIADLYNALYTMQDNKSPGNDGLPCKFYKYFWENIKDMFYEAVSYSKSIGELENSQKQAVIKLIEKKDRDKRFIKNWRPISLLKVDLKIISKALANK